MRLYYDFYERLSVVNVQVTISFLSTNLRDESQLDFITRYPQDSDDSIATIYINRLEYEKIIWAGESPEHEGGSRTRILLGSLKV